jgi:3-oxoacyl-[acyl-carrier-protein] synthase-3
MQPGQLEALTGIRERRWWPEGRANADGAAAAARDALERAGVVPDDLSVLIYAGVCRDHLEPATACDVAAQIGVRPDAEVYDISNACLGVLNGVAAVANRIELGQIRAGMIVSCETARDIVNIAVERMNADPTMETFKLSVATLTGGSGAAAVILTDGSFARDRPRLLGGVARAAPEHHALCRWEIDGRNGDGPAQFMRTDSVAVLKHGVELGARCWRAFLDEMEWTADGVDAVICHQVGAQHRETVLRALGVSLEKDFSTYEHLGNMGTVSLPMTAALAEERGFIRPGARVAWLGIGSGLNCLMLGWEW